MEFEASFNDATGLLYFSSILTLIVGISSNNSGNGISSLVSESEHFAYVFAGGRCRIGIEQD